MSDSDTSRKMNSYPSSAPNIACLRLRFPKMEVNPNVIKLIPSSIAKKYFIIPVNRIGPKLTMAMADPSNIIVIDEVKFMTGFNVEPVVASEAEIIDAIKKYYGGGGSVAGMGNSQLPGR